MAFDLRMGQIEPARVSQIELLGWANRASQRHNAGRTDPQRVKPNEYQQLGHILNSNRTTVTHIYALMNNARLMVQMCWSLLFEFVIL